MWDEPPSRVWLFGKKTILTINGEVIAVAIIFTDLLLLLYIPLLVLSFAYSWLYYKYAIIFHYIPNNTPLNHHVVWLKNGFVLDALGKCYRYKQDTVYNDV